MNVLSFDFGKTTGWSVTLEDGTILWGEKSLVGDEGEIFIGFENLLVGLANEHAIDVVAFEDVRFNRGFSYIPGMMAITMCHCINRGLPYVGVGVSELKKWATGTGNASKGKMILAARSYLVDGINQELTDNEADAILVGRWFLENCVPGDADQAESEPEFSGY